MLMLRILAGLALGPALLAATLQGAAPVGVATTRVEVAVRYDGQGRIACADLIRSTGWRGRDASARQAALELASLAPDPGHTRVFTVAFGG